MQHYTTLLGRIMENQICIFSTGKLILLLYRRVFQYKNHMMLGNRSWCSTKNKTSHNTNIQYRFCCNYRSLYFLLKLHLLSSGALR